MMFIGRREQRSLTYLADRARDAGQWSVAVALYGCALVNDVRNAPLWVQHGHALKESGELKDPTKLAQAETAYRFTPSVADTYLGHGRDRRGKSRAYLRALARRCRVRAYARRAARTLEWKEDDGLLCKQRRKLSSPCFRPGAAHLWAKPLWVYA
jgi:hypothetical protein